MTERNTSSEMEKPKTIAIIGAGISGLLACKHVLQKGFLPTVFEAKNYVGGVWSKTLDSTKLQTPKNYFQFSDFPWPDSVAQEFPDHNQVYNYITSYVVHFNIFPHIKFNSKVISIEYSKKSPGKEDDELWGGSGQAFSVQGGKWNIIVKDTINLNSSDDSSKEYQFDFVILCIGKYSDLANIPQFPVNKGPEVFDAKVLHSMDYAELENPTQFVEGKKVAIIGFQKSGMDIAAEISKVNGIKNPCTLVFRTAHWSVPEKLGPYMFKNLNRFSELMVHKPNEGFFQWLLAAMLSPMLWIFSKIIESYLKWIYPLAEYGVVPQHRFLTQIRTCMLTVLPHKFYDRVREGSIILKKSQSFSFYNKGLIAGSEDVPIETDIVIFATGYASEQKLANIFKSIKFQKCLNGSSAPFYRDSIHPKIPHLAIMGYTDSHATLYTTEMRVKWLACFLAGEFLLPSIREMEENVMSWEKCSTKYTGESYRRFCTGVMLQIHNNDEICKDMKCNPRRKKTVFSEFFTPYGPSDYANLESSSSK